LAELLVIIADDPAPATVAALIKSLKLSPGDMA
jgi:hypothetical protein